mgnify:CR=1 FL=1
MKLGQLGRVDRHREDIDSRWRITLVCSLMIAAVLMLQIGNPTSVSVLGLLLCIVNTAGYSLTITRDSVNVLAASAQSLMASTGFVLVTAVSLSEYLEPSGVITGAYLAIFGVISLVLAPVRAKA